MKLVIDLPKDVIESAKSNPNYYPTYLFEMIWKAIANGTPLPTIIDGLKELSKEHRHNYISNSHEERAWRLGIEDSIDLILAESEVEK